MDLFSGVLQGFATSLNPSQHPLLFHRSSYWDSYRGASGDWAYRGHVHIAPNYLWYGY